jgi:hypothetical protein
MDNLKEFSINDIQRVATENSKEFAIARIAVLSTEPNSHGIIITEEILRRDVPSILGKWIVADINEWTRDASTHTPREKIVGIIPKDQEVEFVTREDGVVVAYVNGVISKIYATDVYDMFVKDNFRNMSVEMATANDRKNEDGTISIDGLEIYGITILGKFVNGSCPSANMEIVKFSADEATEYYNTINTKEKALRLSEELRQFAESLESKDNNDERTIPMEDEVKTKEFSEEDNKDVVMAENETKEEPKSEESKEMAEEPKAEDEKDKSEPAQMAEEPKEGEDDKDDDAEDKDDKDDEKEMSCGEKEMSCGDKEFSLEKFASEDSLKELSDEMAELVKMESADDVIKKFAEKFDEIKKLSERVAELEEFQTKTFEAEKKQKVDAILAEVKTDLDTKQFSELAEEGSKISLEEVGAFANKVKAFAYEASKNKAIDNKEDDGVMLMATVDNNTVVEDGDIWSRLSKKYK